MPGGGYLTPPLQEEKWKKSRFSVRGTPETGNGAAPAECITEGVPFSGEKQIM